MKRTRPGMLTPSSNTVQEPVTTRIALTNRRWTGPAPIIEAARLLADARVDVIAWNVTSAGCLGSDSDVRLCAAITALCTSLRASALVPAMEAKTGLPILDSIAVMV